jgi:hypothetical protein
MMGCMRSRRRLRLFAMVGLAGLLVAACSRGSASPNLSPVTSVPASSVTGSSSSAATPVPSTPVGYPADVPLTGHNVKPGEKPPVYPTAAHARTQAGANAFAEFFMKTLDWAYATTNPSYMKHYYGPTCGQCSGLSTGITKTAASRHWYEGGRLTVHTPVAAAIAPVTAPADFCSLTVVDLTATTVVDQTGKIFNGAGAATGLRFKLCAKSDEDQWRVSYLARL